MDVAAEQVTVLLNRLIEGDRASESQLMPLIYQELKRLARSHLRRERPDHTLEATALVHEAYMRLVKQREHFATRGHFFLIASQVMRRILLDYARQHNRLKRGAGVEPEELNEAIVFCNWKPAEYEELDAALCRLERLEPRQVRIVELRYFAGLTVEEAADLLGVSAKTVKRDWSVARAWLHRELSRASDAY
jgi:RNA polymerase sigma factor (TIGR02999 family)